MAVKLKKLLFLLVYFGALIFITQGQKLENSTDTTMRVCKDRNAQQRAKNALEKVKESHVVDVVFVLDRSKSTEPVFKESKELMQSIIEKYYLAHPDYARIFILTFAKTVTKSFHPEYDNIVSCVIGDIVNSINIMNTRNESVSNLNTALNEAYDILGGVYARANAKKVIWLFSDGKFHDHKVTRNRRSDTEIFTVGQREVQRGWMNIHDENFLKQISFVYSCQLQWRNIMAEVPALNPDNIQGLGSFAYEIDSEHCKDTRRRNQPDADGNKPTNDRGKTTPPPDFYPLTQVCQENSRCYCDTARKKAACLCEPEHYSASGKCKRCPTGTSKSYPGQESCTIAGKDPPLDLPTGSPNHPIPETNSNNSNIDIFGMSVSVALFAVVLAAIIGFVVLVILILILCCCCRKRKEKGDKSSKSKKRRPPPPIPVPEYPKFDPPDYEDAIYGDVDLSNQALYKESLEHNMPGWDKYLIDGVKFRFMSGMCVTTLDEYQWARTPGFKLKKHEARNIAKTLEKVHKENKERPASGYVNAEVQVQGKRYGLFENNGCLLGAYGPLKGRSENILWAGLKGTALVVAKAPKHGDEGQCKEEVLRVMDHLHSYLDNN